MGRCAGLIPHIHKDPPVSQRKTGKQASAWAKELENPRKRNFHAPNLCLG